MPLPDHFVRPIVYLDKIEVLQRAGEDQPPRDTSMPALVTQLYSRPLGKGTRKQDLVYNGFERTQEEEEEVKKEADDGGGEEWDDDGAED